MPESSGEHMIRTWVSADMGQHIHAAAKGPQEAYHLEEEIVALAHDMFELGRALERGDITGQQGQQYLKGFFDAMGIIETGRPDGDTK